VPVHGADADRFVPGFFCKFVMGDAGISQPSIETVLQKLAANGTEAVA
jgi:hypothetical protein